MTDTYRQQWRKNNPEKMQAQGSRARAKHRTKIKQRAAVRHGLRHAFLTRWKLAAGCFDCGYAEHSVALDFDHLGPKAFSMNKAHSRSWKSLLAEIEKCVVRCANCHRVKTHGKGEAK